jgi:protein involved in polysaccharide export with SLBB domain
MKTKKLPRKCLPLVAILACSLSGLAWSQATTAAKESLRLSVDSAMRASALAASPALIQRYSDSTGKFSKPGSKADSGRPVRYGQKALRTADPSLFASTGGSVGADYQVGPGDQMIISVWGQKQARYDVTVDRDGQIYLDGVGMISLNGASFQEAEKIIGRKLGGIYSGMNTGYSHYDVTMGKLKQIRVFVVGDVEHPGGYVFSGASTALQAVATAGGPTDLGSDRVALINRGGQTIEIDLYQYLFLGKRAPKDGLHDGDVVRVPVRRQGVRIDGEVGRPGIYEMLPNETTSNLLEFAGGLTAFAANAPMTLSRLYENGRRDAGSLGSPQDAIDGRRRDPVKDGDWIFVQTGSSRSLSSLFITGAIRYPGIYQYKSGSTLATLLATAGGITERTLTSRAIILREDTLGNRTALRASLDQAAQVILFPMDSVVLADRVALDSAPETVTITGAVRNPGTFNWRQGLRLKDLIVLAGGFLPQADIHAIHVDHKDPRGTVVEGRTLDLDSSLAPNSKDALLEGQTLVSVPAIPGWSPLRTVVLHGLFAHPETYSLKGETERISSVVARAGGPLREAYTEGAVLLRKNVGRLQVDFPRALKHKGSDDDISLIDGDTLLMPPRPATVFVEGRVRKPGHILWRDGKSWEWYVDMAGGPSDSSSEDDLYIEYADGSVRTDRQGLKSPNPGSVVTVPFKVPPQKTSTMEVLTVIGTIVGILATSVTTWFIIQNSKN